MIEYGALLARLRQGLSLDQWNAVLDQIQTDDSAYVGLDNPGYYVGPHSAFMVGGTVYDATRGFLVRDDGTGTMKIVEDTQAPK